MSRFRISEIFFIDDDAIVRMVGKKILKAIEFEGIISQYENGKSALDEIISRASQGQLHEISEPILILLDINMPIMDAWGFLDEFCQLEKAVKEKFLISIITSSIDTSDKEKAFSYPEVLDYISKPLSGKHVTDFLSRHHLFEA